MEEITGKVNLRTRILKLPMKRVPALALVAVALFGMILGVMAASITVTPITYNGETGSYHQNSGTMTITDSGLSIVTDVAGISANTTATFGANGSNGNLFTGSTFTTGHWMDTIVFTDTATDGAAHTVTVKILNGATPPNGGTALAGGTVTLTLTGHGTSSTGTVTAYIDLGVTSVTAPLSMYITST